MHDIRFDQPAIAEARQRDHCAVPRRPHVVSVVPSLDLAARSQYRLPPSSSSIRELCAFRAGHLVPALASAVRSCRPGHWCAESDGRRRRAPVIASMPVTRRVRAGSCRVDAEEGPMRSEISTNSRRRTPVSGRKTVPRTWPPAATKRSSVSTVLSLRWVIGGKISSSCASSPIRIVPSSISASAKRPRRGSRSRDGGAAESVRVLKSYSVRFAERFARLGCVGAEHGLASATARRLWRRGDHRRGGG